MTETIAFITVLTVAVLLVGYLRRLIADDGYTHRPTQPPRSRPLDHFDPWSGAGRFA